MIENIINIYLWLISKYVCSNFSSSILPSNSEAINIPELLENLENIFPHRSETNDSVEFSSKICRLEKVLNNFEEIYFQEHIFNYKR